MMETKRKILIVDDEDNVRDTIMSILERKGFEVDGAANGKECFLKIEDDIPHLVLLDYKLNGETGIDVLKMISDKWEEIAVIMLTGAGADNVRLAADSIKSGAYEYITKPPDFAILPLLINKTIDLHQEKLERKRAEERHKLELYKANRRLEDIAVELKKEKGRLEAAIKDMGRQNMELENAQKAKTEFLANVSHELRTPLNAIMGFSDLLLDDSGEPLSEKQKKYVNNILSGGRRLLRLIDDLLDLSKVELLKSEVNYDEFPLRHIIDDALKMVIEKAQDKNIVIETNLDKSLGSIVMDERKFKQIMYQLLDNAVKFTPEKGRVAIDISVINRDKLLKELPAGSDVSLMYNGDFIRFSISDTGIGISFEDQKRLFKSFEKIDSGYTREYEGTGLGLVLTKKLVELLGGYIWVESRFGSGSRFSFVLPFYKSISLDLCLEKGINYARKNHLPLALILGVIDHAEDIRARIGDDKYKEIITYIENIFRNDIRFRKDDMCIYKDMEIVGVLAGTDKKGGESMMSRIKGLLKEDRFTEKGIKLSVKIGMAFYPEDAVSKEELLQIAERRALGEKENAP
ncbi:MAG: response regulator [Nitrospirae bacterium]|nr:response regulator [Nitrospirota bacterium]